MDDDADNRFQRRIQRADKQFGSKAAIASASAWDSLHGVIPEEDASKFLYWYPSGSLADVMDRKSVKGSAAAAEVAANIRSMRCAPGNRKSRMP